MFWVVHATRQWTRWWRIFLCQALSKRCRTTSQCFIMTSAPRRKHQLNKHIYEAETPASYHLNQKFTSHVVQILMQGYIVQQSKIFKKISAATRSGGFNSRFICSWLLNATLNVLLQEAQLSQRGRATLRIVENVANLLKVMRHYTVA